MALLGHASAAVARVRLVNIYGALAEQNTLYEYHDKREIYTPTIDMLLAFPVSFGLIDALYSADGPLVSSPVVIQSDKDDQRR